MTEPLHLTMENTYKYQSQYFPRVMFTNEVNALTCLFCSIKHEAIFPIRLPAAGVTAVDSSSLEPLQPDFK